jgi:hypothetical protein
LKDDEVFNNQVDIEFYSNQLFEDWKKINNLSKRSEIVGTLLGVMNGEKPYFHIEWIMDNVFKLTPEQKAENERYWARDIANAASSATGEPGAEGAPAEGGEMPAEGGGEAPVEGGGEAQAAAPEAPAEGGGGEEAGGGEEFEF